MSNSLHNKIYLGRQRPFATRLLQRVLLIGAIVGVAVVSLLVTGWH